MSNCMSIVNDMDDADQEALLNRLSDLEKSGLSPKDSQLQAVNSLIKELEDAEFFYQRGDLSVDVPVKVEDTGEIAVLTMNVSGTIKDYTDRSANLKRLLDCV